MAERPILFSAEMTAAILRGKKTETRRVVKSTGTQSPVQEPWEEFEPGIFGSCATDGTTAVVRCPYGKPGDRLYVKETFAVDARYDRLPASRIPRAELQDLAMRKACAARPRRQLSNGFGTN